MARTRKVEPAARKGQYLRVAIGGGPSGGKTYTGLLLASVLDKGGGTTVIDTEVSGPESWATGLYAGQFGDFQWDIWGWPAPYSPQDLAEAMWEEAKLKDVIMVDSASPFWHNSGGILAHRDEASAMRFRGNDWAAWSEVRPIQENLIYVMQNCPAHVILCARSKIEWAKGERNPTAIGTALKQDPELEHEVTVSVVIDRDRGHTMTVRKSRLLGLDSSSPGMELGPEDQRQEFGRWLDWADSAEHVEPRATADDVQKVRDVIRSFTPSDVKEAVKRQFGEEFGMTGDLRESQISDALAWLTRAPEEILGSGEQPVKKKATRAKKKEQPVEMSKLEKVCFDAGTAVSEIEKALLVESEKTGKKLWPASEVATEDQDEAVRIAEAVLVGVGK